jgi:hypothetical protein
MSSIVCLSIAGVIVSVWPHAQFALGWTHSIEKTRIEELWQVDPVRSRLVLKEQRLSGSGAGFDPPEHARLTNGRWVTEGRGRSVERLRLARSGHAGDWELCSASHCQPIESLLNASLSDALLKDEPVELTACLRRAR